MLFGIDRIEAASFAEMIDERSAPAEGKEPEQAPGRNAETHEEPREKEIGEVAEGSQVVDR